MFAEFFERGVIGKGMNATFIVLVPKKEETRDFSNFRPISLVGSLYKIISKVLSIRMHNVMQNMVSSSQGAFVKDRQIVDGILIANEVADGRKKMQETRSGVQN